MRRRTHASDMRGFARVQRRLARERAARVREYAGVRSVRVSPQTGTVVAVYDARAAGMDTAAGRWSTVCEDHSTIISHRTLALAEYHAAAVADWCEPCRKEMPR